jgi:hypothetical protein
MTSPFPAPSQPSQPKASGDIGSFPSATGPVSDFTLEPKDVDRMAVQSMTPVILLVDLPTRSFATPAAALSDTSPRYERSRPTIPSSPSIIPIESQEPMSKYRDNSPSNCSRHRLNDHSHSFSPCWPARRFPFLTSSPSG